MTAATMKHFDVLNFVEQSKVLGMNEELAKFQARQIEQAIDLAVDTAKTEIENKELATKQDIKQLELDIEKVRAEIQKSKFDLVIWVAGLLIASGVIQHFFK